MRLTVSAYVAGRLVGLNKKDLQILTYKGSGPGGQHRNKVETAVRMLHIETGISAVATENKSQSQNKRAAFKRLVLRLIDHYQKEEKFEAEVQIAMKRIRTYNEQRGTVKDHRTGKVASYKKVLDGDLDSLTVTE